MHRPQRRTANFEELLIKKIDLEDALLDLKFLDQCVLLFRYYENEQFSRIAERLDMKLEAVIKIEQRAIQKLRKRMLP